jgi:hypothetical protein
VDTRPIARAAYRVGDNLTTTIRRSVQINEAGLNVSSKIGEVGLDFNSKIGDFASVIREVGLDFNSKIEKVGLDFNSKIEKVGLDFNSKIEKASSSMLRCAWFVASCPWFVAIVWACSIANARIGSPPVPATGARRRRFLLALPSRRQGTTMETNRLHARTPAGPGLEAAEVRASPE